LKSSHLGFLAADSSLLPSAWNFLFLLNLFACWNLFFGILSPCCLFLNCFTPFFPGFVAHFSKLFDVILGPPSWITFLENVLMNQNHYCYESIFFSCYNGDIVNHAFVLMVFLKAIYVTIQEGL